LIAFLALCPALAAQLPHTSPAAAVTAAATGVQLGSTTGERAAGVDVDRTLLCGR